MNPSDLISQCLADPLHAKCKKFLIDLHSGSNGKCSQVPRHRDLKEIAEASGHAIHNGHGFRFIEFYDVSTDTTTYFVQRD